MEHNTFEIPENLNQANFFFVSIFFVCLNASNACWNMSIKFFVMGFNVFLDLLISLVYIRYIFVFFNIQWFHWGILSKPAIKVYIFHANASVSRQSDYRTDPKCPITNGFTQISLDTKILLTFFSFNTVYSFGGKFK